MASDSVPSQSSAESGIQADSEISSGLNTIDQNHPLYFHPSVSTCSILIPCQLTGRENYVIWSRSMLNALLAMNKVGFVDGSCSIDKFDKSLHLQWRRCDALVTCWLTNTISKDLLSIVIYAKNACSAWNGLKEMFGKTGGLWMYYLQKEIAMLTQGDMSITEYYSKMKYLLEELDSLAPSPAILPTDFMEHLQQQKLFQFLMGLNENYSQARSRMLLCSPLPTVNQAHSILVQEEYRMALEQSSMFSGGKQSQGGAGERKLNETCEHCHKFGHIKERCYRIIGFPTNFKSTSNKCTKCTYCMNGHW